MATKEEILKIINSITEIKKDFDDFGEEDLLEEIEMIEEVDEEEEGEEKKEREPKEEKEGVPKSTIVLRRFLSHAEEKSFSLLVCFLSAFLFPFSIINNFLFRTISENWKKHQKSY